MSTNRKNAMIYFAAALFLAIAAYLNINNSDWVFVAVCGVSAVVFFIAGITSHKNARRNSRKKSSGGKKSKKK